MATTTTALSLRNPAGGDSINVTTDISANNTKVDNQFRKGSTLTSTSSLPLGDEWMNEVTGSTTITSLSTKNAGLRQLLGVQLGLHDLDHLGIRHHVDCVVVGRAAEITLAWRCRVAARLRPLARPPTRRARAPARERSTGTGTRTP